MASDKFKDIFANRPTFVKGEQPTGRKFTQWAQQTDQAFLELEKAIGNMWGSFWIENDISPILLNTLARSIGALDHINPLVPHSVDVNSYVQGTIAGQRYLWLDLFPNGTGGTWLTVSTDNAIVPASYVADRTLLIATGEWTIEGRKIYTFDSLDGAGAEVTYNGTTGDGTGGTPKGDLGTYFTVIPHLQQLTGVINTACNVVQKQISGETYYEVTLPTYQVDYDGNVPIVGTNVQLTLPPQAVLLAGEEIPHGIVRLWDGGDPVDVSLAQPISDTARYYAVSDTVFHIYNVLIEGMGNPEDDVNTRYFVVTGGSSVAETLGRVWRRIFQHTHGPYDYIPGVKHGELDDLEFNGLDINGSPLAWLKDYSQQSIIANNNHPQYVYREGYQTTDPGSYYNAMVGDFVMANEDATNRHRNVTGDSFKLYFMTDGGPYVFYDNTEDRLIFSGIVSGFQFGKTGDPVASMDALFKGTMTVEQDVTMNADLSVGVELSLAGYMVNEISNDDTMATDSATALCTEAAIKGYVDTEVAKPLDIPTGTIILSESASIAGYTMLADEDDLTIIITDTLGDLGNNNGEAWTAPVANHSHRFHMDSKQCWDANGNPVSIVDPRTGKTTTGLITNVWHADSKAAAGDRFTEKIAYGGDDTWRPPGRFYARWQRN